MAIAKGSTLRATMEFVRGEHGSEALEQVLARMPAEERGKVERAAPTDELPFDLALELWRATDAVVGERDPGWMERAGEQSIESTGVQLYGGILRKSTPTEFLTQGVSLFQLYYHPGNMEVVEAEEGRAVLRLVGFDHPDPLFCRRQTGGLRQALTLAGGTSATARHVRCVNEGDAFCEWELGWK
ncbi:MAG TPA: hypothetical protein VKA84_28345 [Gemmatimonadaceae bacterium]|nr:hypothetical protein [Gemmatimonadaceae bacterium]